MQRSQFLELFTRNVHRQYREYEDNVSFIKGKIDFIEVIADVKYKNPLTISQPDIYQILSYAVHYNCPNLFLIYPAFKNDSSMVDKPIEYSIDLESGNISLTTIQVDVFEKDIKKIKKKLADIVLSSVINSVCQKDIS